MSKATFEQRGDLGEVVISDLPLNLVDLELAADLQAAVDQASQSGARAILVRAEGDNFSAGANVEMFLCTRDEQAARDHARRVSWACSAASSRSPVPTVCAVQGSASRRDSSLRWHAI